MGEPVGRADDEVAERVARVEVEAAALRPAHAAGLEPDLATGGLGRPSGGAIGSLLLRVLGQHAGQALADLEVDLDAVAHDAGQRLADQRAVAGLEPVLGEAVGDRDAEAVVIDRDEGGLLQPGLEVGGRERNLKLAQGGAPDLLRVHRLPPRLDDFHR